MYKNPEVVGTLKKWKKIVRETMEMNYTSELLLIKFVREESEQKCVNNSDFSNKKSRLRGKFL